jgi:hypothetical protein
MHRVYFLHIASGPESTNNILALALGVQKNVSVLLAEVTGVDLIPHRASTRSPVRGIV